MKHALMILLLAAGLSPAGQQPDTERLPLKEMVKSNVPENWKVIADGNRIIASTENVKFLYMVSPALSYEDPWEKAVTKDFLIEIRTVPLISPEAFEKLRQLRKDLLAERVLQWEKSKGGKIDGKVLYGFRKEIDDTVPLPYCHDEVSSYFIYSSDQDVHATRPALALTCAKAVKEGLRVHRRLYLPMVQAPGTRLETDPASDIEAPPEGN
ncbi:MAG: hypothetical protein QM755_00170 [Luteolibacter sp.]